MATNDNASLLRKVVSFVSNPGLRKSAADDGAQSAVGQAPDKAAIQAMMDRKLHNDIVRKREFELLRQMRKREPQANRIDLSERTSMFSSSILTRPGGRAQTIKKIDEIEQQMSQQWWKGKQVPATPLAMEKPPESAVAPPPVVKPMASLPEVPAPAPPVVATEPKLEPTAGRLEASLYDDPPTSGAAEFPPTKADQFVHEPEIEDAAILFANGDYEAATQSLLSLMRDGDALPIQEAIWMTLFDLYRSTGDRTRFEGAAIDFAARFGRSAPQWGPSMDIRPPEVAPQIAGLSVVHGTDWSAPAELSLVAVEKLKSIVTAGTARLRVSWAQLVRVQADAVAELASVFSEICQRKLQMQFTGTKNLEEILRNETPAGDAEIQQEWWICRLNFLRLGRREDEFELVALDYCITYEMSPPAWEPAQCEFKHSALEIEGVTLGEGGTLLMGEELLSTRAGTFSNSGAADLSGYYKTELGSDSSFKAPKAFGTAELTGEVLGNAVEVLESLDRALEGHTKLLVDCKQLIRVDFPAAGALLNWASAQTAEQHQVEFRNVNRLVATFFSVIGVDEFARIVPPTH